MQTRPGSHGPVLTGLGAAFLDVACGSVCVLCGRPGTLTCWRCAQRVHDLGAAFAASTDPPCAWLTPPAAAPGEPVPVWAPMPYRRPLSGLVVVHKEHAALGLAPVLAGLVRWSVTRALREQPLLDGEQVWLVPVPSAPRVTRRRGHDPTGTITRQAARLLRGGGVPARQVRLLRSTGQARDQVGLGAAARHENLHGSMRLRRSTPNSQRVRLLLVDDVVTSGATLTEGVRALSEGGLVVAAAVVAAHTPPPSR